MGQVDQPQRIMALMYRTLKDVEWYLEGATKAGAGDYPASPHALYQAVLATLRRAKPIIEGMEGI